MVTAGTLRCAVPGALGHPDSPYPPLKRWALLCRPAGGTAGTDARDSPYVYYFGRPPMRITYDQEVDGLYIRFQETTVTTKHLAEGIAADYDSEGRNSWD